MAHTRPPTRPPAAGFTMIELLVVISIILAVLAIGVIGIAQLAGQSNEDQTRIALGQLQAAAADYHEQVGTWPADIGDMGSKDSAPATTRDLLLQIPKHLRGGDAASDINGVTDAWGNGIVYADDISAAGEFGDSDLGYRPGAPYFFSPGPDGRKGARTSTGELDDDAKDNIFSYDIDD